MYKFFIFTEYQRKNVYAQITPRNLETAVIPNLEMRGLTNTVIRLQKTLPVTYVRLLNSFMNEKTYVENI